MEILFRVKDHLVLSSEQKGEVLMEPIRTGKREDRLEILVTQVESTFWTNRKVTLT